MVGDKWWGWLHKNGVVTITQQDPNLRWSAARHTTHPVVRVVGPFLEDLADEFEGDQRMVRRRIMAALYNTSLGKVIEVTR